VATADGSLAAHWENTIAITADGPRILTEHATGVGTADRATAKGGPATAETAAQQALLP
jgi:hypothetical protein